MQNDYKGYDPYDTLNSFIPFGKLGKWPPILAIQLQKRNPINIRPLIGIKKGHNPKAMGLMLEAFCRLYEKTNIEAYKEHANYLFEWLANNNTKGYSGTCWGYNFPWASKLKYLPSYSPTSVVTGFVIRGIYKYYEVFRNPKARDIIISAATFIETDILRHTDKDGVSFSYSTAEKDVCYNASLLAAEVLSYSHVLKPNNEYKDLVLRAVNFVIKRQHKNGRWNYSLNPETKKEREQIDFHQGFLLDSIYAIQENLKIEDYDENLRLGLHYYLHNQFLSTGQSIFRLPKVWPADIHNQAQGIITIGKIRPMCEPQLKGFDKTILNWTMKNLYNSNKGYFQYKKYPLYKINLPAIRWAQAWMLLALSFREQSL